MADKNTAVFGIYPQISNLENALNELKQAGFRHEDISVLFPENLGSKELTTVKATKGPEGIAAGAGSGAVVGGALGWLAGIVGISDTGDWPLHRRRPDCRCARWRGRGKRCRRYHRRTRRSGHSRVRSQALRRPRNEGGILLSVHCDDSKWAKLAKQILEQTGAQDIASTGEAAADYEKNDRPRPLTGTYGR